MQVIPGAANEALTAALPMFINPTHWVVAREKLKTLLGWTCTLNILGFSYQQVQKPSCPLFASLAGFCNLKVLLCRSGLPSWLSCAV